MAATSSSSKGSIPSGYNKCSERGQILKHMADHIKNSGSNLESRALYMQAALKFLHVASVFESCHKEIGRYGDMIN
ncbi:hypothetical protein L2E82_01861 [Cichorium intybus]|uniref:Uncharacterized protein n=1 Tax=Cichorium intybus TaxID=13427 RepID=A0ACB9H019_CICIN|nr:hypothetical protein L2E82_01861 [Cichorium intybus]